MPLARPVLIDAFLGITRATPGRGTLLFHAEDTVLVDGRAEYRPRQELPASVLDAPDDALLDFRLLAQ